VPTLLAAALTLPLLLLGGTTRPSLVASIALVGVLAAVVIARARTSRERSPGAKWASAGLWLAVGASCVQLVPLPPSVLAAISPHAHAIWSASAAEFGFPLGWRPLTLDPPATEFCLATSICVAFAFEAFSRASSGADGRRNLAIAASSAVLIMCVVALLHQYFGIDRLYGVYEPKHSGALESGVLAPLLNPNHAAAAAGVAPPLLLGVFAETNKAGYKLLALAGAAFAGSLAVLTLSRGGMIVLALELLAMLALLLIRRSTRQKNAQRGSRWGGLAGVVVVACLSVGGALHLASPFVAREAGNRDVSKLQIPLQALQLVRDFRWTGAGRGAFGSVFPAYGAGLGGGHVRFTHVENWPVQILADFGVPVTVALAVLFLAAIALSARRLLERPTTAGATVALGGLVVHDLADFSMDFLGVALLAAALLAMATSGGTHRIDATVDRRSPARSGALVAIAAACAVGVGAKSWNRGLDDETAFLAQLWAARGLRDLDAAVATAAARHPAEPYFPMLRGVQLLDSPEGGPHLARAESLAPNWAMTHFWIAQWFARAGRTGQAWAEFREARRLDPSLTDAVMRAMVRLGAPIDDVVTVAVDARAMELAAAELDKAGRAKDGPLLDERILILHPESTGARMREIRRDAETGRSAVALEKARQLLAAHPELPDVVLLAASLEPDAQAAEKILEDGLARSAGDRELLRALILRRGKRLGLGAVEKELDALRSTLSSAGGGVELPYLLESEIELAAGRPGSAVAKLLDAASIAQDPAPILERAARIAETAGELGVCESVWRRLTDLYPASKTYSVELERVHRLALQRALLGRPSGN
jgi:hypothetical protein